MAKESKSCRKISQEGIKIFAYGFDAASFDTPSEPITLTNIGSVEFIQFEDATNLDSADGVIIPQGIIDEYGNVLMMIEVKGTKSGIKREYVNQVDSHRERNELPNSVPGVLLINNEMSVVGIEERLKTQVSNDQVKHAKNINILIVRTIDLLLLMKHLENNPDRKDELMRLLSSGGGWLKADSEGYEIV